MLSSTTKQEVLAKPYLTTDQTTLLYFFHFSINHFSITPLAFTCSKSILATLGKGVKHVQS